MVKTLSNRRFTEELNKALGAFLICFGQGLPAELKNRIRDRTYLMAAEIERNGEPTVAMLARGLADALSEQLPRH